MFVVWEGAALSRGQRPSYPTCNPVGRRRPWRGQAGGGAPAIRKPPLPPHPPRLRICGADGAWGRPAPDMAAAAVRGAKRSLRAELKQRLRTVSAEERLRQSRLLTQKVRGRRPRRTGPKRSRWRGTGLRVCAGAAPGRAHVPRRAHVSPGARTSPSACARLLSARTSFAACRDALVHDVGRRAAPGEGQGQSQGSGVTPPSQGGQCGGGWRPWWRELLSGAPEAPRQGQVRAPLRQRGPRRRRPGRPLVTRGGKRTLVPQEDRSGVKAGQRTSGSRGRGLGPASGLACPWLAGGGGGGLV